MYLFYLGKKYKRPTFLHIMPYNLSLHVSVHCAALEAVCLVLQWTGCHTLEWLSGAITDLKVCHFLHCIASCIIEMTWPELQDTLFYSAVHSSRTLPPKNAFCCCDCRLLCMYPDMIYTCSEVVTSSNHCLRASLRVSGRVFTSRRMM